MKIAAVACIALFPLAAHAADPLEDELIAMEKASWVAWKAHDSKFYEMFLSDDHLEIHGMGVGGKAGVVTLGVQRRELHRRSLGIPAPLARFRAPQLPRRAEDDLCRRDGAQPSARHLGLRAPRRTLGERALPAQRGA